MFSTHLRRNEDELAIIRRITESDDVPVLVLNLNSYSPAAGFPNGDLRRQWRLPIFVHAVGEQQTDKLVAVWHPSHQAFIDLQDAPGAEENSRPPDVCLAQAVIHRCSGDGPPVLTPSGAP